MANNRMNFGVGINLYTDKFKRGAKQVNGWMKSMKGQVLALSAAFGVGAIGMGNFFSKAFETVKSLNKAQTTLKNVTKTSTEYNKAMDFLNANAKKYNQGIIELTNNYSKFVAASQGTGMALKDVQNTFEALTQASTYYNLSADETNGVMLALSQMMSKGKIQAEELRGQLGERLPGALGVMARALGVTQKELDKLMQDGKLISSEVLPKFGEQLKIETAGFDANTLQGSLTKMKDMWVKMWASPEIQDAFKKLVTGLTTAMQWAANNISTIFNGSIAIMIAYASSAMGKMLAKFEAMQKSVALRYANIVRQGNNLGTAQNSFGYKMSDMFRPEHSIIVDQYRDAMREWLNPQNPKDFANGLKNCNSLLRDMTYKGISFANVAEKWQREIEPLNRQMELLGAEVGGVDNAARMFANNIDNSNTRTNRLGRAWQMVSIRVNQMGNYLKDMVMNNWITALIGAVYFLGKSIWDAFQKAKELRNMVGNTIDSINNTKGQSTTLVAVEAMLKEYKGINGQIEKQKKLLSDIQKLLGMKEVKGEDRLTTEKRINDEFEKRKQLILDEARAQAAASKIVENENKIKELEDKKAARNREIMNGDVSALGALWQGTKMMLGFKSDFQDWDAEIAALKASTAEINKVFGNLIAASELNKVDDGTTGGTTGGTELSEDRQKILDDYKKKWDELANQYDKSVLTEREYQEAVYKLAKEVRESLGKFDTLSQVEQSVFDFLGTIQDASEIVEDAFKNIQKDFTKSVKEISNQFGHGAITQEEYNEAMASLYDSIIKQIASMDNLTAEQEKFLRDLIGDKGRYTKDEALKISKPGTRDTTFDYQLSNAEIDIKNIEFDIEAAKQLEEELREAVENGAKELETALNAAMANVTSLEDALKVQQVKNDIKDLQNQLATSSWDGFKNLGQSSDRLVNAWTALQEVMDDEESTKWERLITTFNTLIQTVDTLVGLFQMIKNIIEISNKIAQAGATATIASKISETSAIAANTAATTVETAAKVALAKANENVAVTGAAASVASTPIVGAALAAAAATSTSALLKSLQAFETGGIVGGNSFSGDKNIVRVNSGEMILNKAQQSTMFSMLNGKGGFGNGNVEFKLRGSDLYGCFTNYSKKTSRY